MTPEDKKKLLDQLEALKIFPNNKLVKELRKQILVKLERLTKKKEPIISEIPKEEKKIQFKAKLSSRAKKYWRFIKLAHDRVPNLKVSEIRRQFKKRREQGQSDIPDAIWQNLSG